MDWKPIPEGEEYFICREGLVIREKHFENGEPNLEKAIKPTVQGKHCYVRIRRQGKEKKIQLIRVFIELFPEVFEQEEVVVDTLKGSWSLTGELQESQTKTKAESPVRSSAKPAAKAAARAQRIQDQSEGHRLNPPSVASEGGMIRCSICDFKKSCHEFTLRSDICNDCFLDREELLKEVVLKRRRSMTRPDAIFMRSPASLEN